MPGMMEKGPELLGKSRSANGGAKSPAGGGGSSANGGLHFSEPESGCSSDDEHGDVGMRVGAEYQARIPEFDPGRYICSQENPVSLSLFSRARSGVAGVGMGGVTGCECGEHWERPGQGRAGHHRQGGWQAQLGSDTGRGGRCVCMAR